MSITILGVTLTLLEWIACLSFAALVVLVIQVIQIRYEVRIWLIEIANRVRK